MKRILHVIGKMDRAGAETMLMNLYRHIDRSKIQFDFITFTKEKGDYDDEIVSLGGKIIPIIAKNPIERLIKLQKFLKANPEYIIVHELLHLLEPNHGDRFMSLLEQHMPNWQSRKQMLSEMPLHYG